MCIMKIACFHFVGDNSCRIYFLISQTPDQMISSLLCWLFSFDSVQVYNSFMLFDVKRTACIKVLQPPCIRIKSNLILVVYLSSSSSESHLLPVVLPALILLIFITVTILVLIKIKLQKEMGKLARQHLLGCGCCFAMVLPVISKSWSLTHWRFPSLDTHNQFATSTAWKRNCTCCEVLEKLPYIYVYTCLNIKQMKEMSILKSCWKLG